MCTPEYSLSENISHLGTLFDPVVTILVEQIELGGSQNPLEGFMVWWTPALGKVYFFWMSLSNLPWGNGAGSSYSLSPLAYSLSCKETGSPTLASSFRGLHHSFLGDLGCPVSQAKKNTTNKWPSPKPSKDNFWVLTPFAVRFWVLNVSVPLFLDQVAFQSPGSMTVSPVINTHPKGEICVVWARTRRDGKESHCVVLV